MTYGSEYDLILKLLQAVPKKIWKELEGCVRGWGDRANKDRIIPSL